MTEQEQKELRDKAHRMFQFDRSGKQARAYVKGYMDAIQAGRGWQDGFNEGYEKATSEARKEINKNYTPNDQVTNNYIHR